MTQPTHQDQNGLALASLILGIVSVTGFGPLTGVPAIITGIMGLKNPVNKGMSWAGIIMGGITTALTILVILFFVLLMVIAAATGSLHDSGSSDSPSSSSQPNYNQRRT